MTINAKSAIRFLRLKKGCRKKFPIFTAPTAILLKFYACLKELDKSDQQVKPLVKLLLPKADRVLLALMASVQNVKDTKPLAFSYSFDIIDLISKRRILCSKTRLRKLSLAKI